VVRALFGGDEGALDGCSGVETSRAFAILVVLAVGVGPLGLSMMAALCWGLRRAGRVTAALAGPPTAPTGPTRAPGADPGPHSPAGAGPESRAAPPVVR
jgi:hypothetical protein